MVDDGIVCALADGRWYVTFTSSGAAATPRRRSRTGPRRSGTRCTSPTSPPHGARSTSRARSARELLGRLSADSFANEAFPYLRQRDVTVGRRACKAIRLGFVGELSYELHHPSEHSVELWDALLEAGADLGIRPHGLDALRLLRLEKGHIIVGQDTDFDATPAKLNMSWAVRSDKPWFVGKRGLERAAAHDPQRKLVAVRFAALGAARGRTAARGRHARRPAHLVGLVARARVRRRARLGRARRRRLPRRSSRARASRARSSSTRSTTPKASGCVLELVAISTDVAGCFGRAGRARRAGGPRRARDPRRAHRAAADRRRARRGRPRARAASARPRRAGARPHGRLRALVAARRRAPRGLRAPLGRPAAGAGRDRARARRPRPGQGRRARGRAPDRDLVASSRTTCAIASTPPAPT